MKFKKQPITEANNNVISIGCKKLIEKFKPELKTNQIQKIRAELNELYQSEDYNTKTINEFRVLLLNTVGDVQYFGSNIVYEKEFNGAKSLESISLPPSVTEVEQFAFSRTNISSLVCPTSLEHIEGFAFEGSPIRNVSFNEGLKVIGSYAFSGTKLSGEIYLPKSLRFIGEGAFSGCPELERIVLQGEDQELRLMPTAIEYLVELHVPKNKKIVGEFDLDNHPNVTYY